MKKKSTVRKARSTTTSSLHKKNKSKLTSTKGSKLRSRTLSQAMSKKVKYTDELVQGTISINSRGFGFVTPEGMNKNEADIFVPKDYLKGAMNKDVVQVQLAEAATSTGNAREGRVVGIVEHANKRIVGTYSASRHFGFVTPDDTRLKADIYIPDGQSMDAITGAKVVAEIDLWPEDGQKAEGHIVEVIGQKGEPGVDILSIMRQYDLSETFPDEVQAAADAVPQSINGDEFVGVEGREDRRHLKIVTVDGEDAKDLDDGVYVEKREDGSFFLGVYIADVSYYVREGEPLDVEAEARGTSVYLVDRVVPMLPKALSNGICSLNAGVDRLSMACEMIVSPEGKIVEHKILPVVIHVYRRLTYTLVNKVLVDKDKEFIKDNEDILPLLYNLQDVRNAMFKYRHRRGAINFEIPEIKVLLDENGKAVGLKKRVGNLGESIIEQCMLAANETVAEHMCRRKQPFVYRVHEEPEEGKITALNGLLSTFGLYIRVGSDGSIQPKDLQTTLEKIAGGPAEKIVSTVALRSMQQARYAAENLGHFGLAATYYTHFTSPIRRYPDLMVHRLLREAFATGSIPKEKRTKIIESLGERADHASQRERVAVNAERDTTDLKKVEYMVPFVGDTFTGVISSVTGFGIFVELENGIEGLVHMTTLKDDYYEYNEAEYALIGQHHKQRYQLGDEVEVVLVRADVEARALDFVVKDNCDPHALTMQNSEDRKVDKKKPAGKGAKAKKTAKAGKSTKSARKQFGGYDVGYGEASSYSKKKTKKEKHSKDKHSKRKGKRRSGRDVIASFDPLGI